MYNRSVITLDAEDSDEVCSSLMHALWKERMATASSIYTSNPPGSYYQIPSNHVDEVDISKMHPNLVVVNPQQQRWRVSDTYSAGDDSVFDGLWRGNAVTIQRPGTTAATAGLLGVSSGDAMPLYRKGVVRMGRFSEKNTSIVCRWQNSDEENTLDAIRAVSEACDFTESIDLFFPLLSADRLHHPQHLLELIRDDFGASVAVPLFLLVSADTTTQNDNTNSTTNYTTNNTANQSVFSEVARAAALQSILAECSDLASLIAPINAPNNSYGSSDVGGQQALALAIDTLLSFRLNNNSNNNNSNTSTSSANTNTAANSSRLSTRDWALRCTGEGRYPVVFLEATLQPLTDIDSQIFNTLNRMSVTPYHNNTICNGRCRNPFFTSFAPVLPSVMRVTDIRNHRSAHNQQVVDSDDSADDSSDEENDNHSNHYNHYNSNNDTSNDLRVYERPLSNFVALRCLHNDTNRNNSNSNDEEMDIAQALYLQCVQSPYKLSAVSVVDGLPAAYVRPPSYTNNNTNNGDSNMSDRMEEYWERRADREQQEQEFNDNYRNNKSDGASSANSAAYTTTQYSNTSNNTNSYANDGTGTSRHVRQSAAVAAHLAAHDPRANNSGHSNASTNNARNNANSANNSSSTDNTTTANSSAYAHVQCVGASLGASRDTGRYLATQRKHWERCLQNNSSSLALKLRLLEMLKYENDDIERVSNTLLTLSERYLSA